MCCLEYNIYKTFAISSILDDNHINYLIVLSFSELSSKNIRVLESFQEIKPTIIATCPKTRVPDYPGFAPPDVKSPCRSKYKIEIFVSARNSDAAL